MLHYTSSNHSQSSQSMIYLASATQLITGHYQQWPKLKSKTIGEHKTILHNGQPILVRVTHVNSVLPSHGISSLILLLYFF